jgi:hypothetical protein
MWHAQPTGLSLRLYDSDDAQSAFDNKEPFLAVAQVVLLGQGRAFIHSALTKDGKRLSSARWLEIGTLLKENWGVTEVMIERHGKLVNLSTANR